MMHGEESWLLTHPKVTEGTGFRDSRRFSQGRAGTEGPGLLTCIPGSRARLLGLGPLVRNPRLTEPRSVGGRSGPSPYPLLFSAGPAGPASVPNASHPTGGHVHHERREAVPEGHGGCVRGRVSEASTQGGLGGRGVFVPIPPPSRVEIVRL